VLRFWALLPSLLFYLFLLALPYLAARALPWVEDA
jgi:hypothetical protein